MSIGNDDASGDGRVGLSGGLNGLWASGSGPVERLVGMAFLRKTIRDDYPSSRSKGISIGVRGFVRWIAVPGIGLALASWSMATVAGLYSAAALSANGSLVPQILPQQARILSPESLKQDRRVARLAPIFVRGEKAERLAFALDVPLAILSLPEELTEDPFAKVVAGAEVSPGKLLAAFADAGMKMPRTADQLAMDMPVQARFHRAGDETGLGPEPDRFGTEADGVEIYRQALALTGDAEIELAYAMPSQASATSVLDRFAPLLDDQDDEGIDVLGEEAPDDVPLPGRRPKNDPAPSKKSEDAKPAKPSRADNSKPSKSDDGESPLKKLFKRSEKPSEALAYARPDRPDGSASKSFGNLFKAPRPGAGTAIYDISAGVVHMPDGSKLEAHSGIGKMVDNPRYVHVKMNGPTPPNVYKLSMREKRFYGVEALRMTPVGKAKMHGRDGILAHSYLLRNGKAQSHGCVAFKDYARFLKAYKAGKVTQLIVVESMSKASQARVASNGDGA